MAVTFTRQPTRDAAINFYCGDCTEPGPCPYRVGRPYFLLDAGKQAKDSLTLKEIWEGGGRYAGLFIFVGEPIMDIDDFVLLVREFVAGWGGTNPRILWFSDPRLDPLDGFVLGITPSGVTTGPDTFSLRNISLTIDNSLGTSLFDGNAIQVTPTDEHGITLRAETDGVAYEVPAGVIVPMRGEGSGTFQFRIDFERSVLFDFGGDVRYFSPGAGPGTLISRRYPVYNLGTQAAAIPFDGQFDPIRADTKTGTRTRFSFGDLPKGRSYESYFRTNTGRQVLLTPRPEARLMLASSPAAPEDGAEQAYYLTPAGPFRLDFEADATGETAGSAAPERLMTGSLGTEFVRADAGDTLEFVPDQAAYAPVFPLLKGGIEASLLDPKLRTSWITVTSGLPNTNFGYYAQPESAAYYGQGDGAGNLFLDALEVRISAIEGGPFPGVPYTGVKTSPNGGGETINPGIDLAAFEAFERQILNPSRRLAVPRNPNGPVFVADSPASAAGNGSRQGFVVRTKDDKPTGLTPQGLVAELNDGSGEAAEGTWNTLILAKDASGKGRDLTFAPPEGDPTLAQPLADALMRNDLFLVLSRDKTVPWMQGEEVSNIGIFQSKATIGDFTLNLAPSPEAGRTDAVILFKFRTDKSVYDLAADLQSWTEPGNFNDAAPDGFPIQRYLVDYLDANDNPRLAYFKKVVNSPGWTGILVLNFGIGGDDLPFQMQGLVGGLKEPLQGHHFGIEISQIDTTTATIEESSLFGLIQYPPIPASRKSLRRIEPLELPATYSVKELAVVFANSAIDDFSCRVHLTINELFGREVELRNGKLDDKNTFEIRGTYQDHGGQSTFTFTCEDDNLFATVVEPDTAVARVLSRVSITQAEFVTLSAEKQGDKTEIAARFTLQGGLAFNPDALALDLFSFGADEAGGDNLAFTNTALDASFAIPRESNENLLLVFNPSEMTFDVGRKPTPRPGSLVASLPMTLSGFKYSAEGLTKADLGASPVGSPQLLNDADEAPTFAEYPASLPKYALDFVLPMGTLGALSSVGVSFDARLMLAWGESETVPENDAAALFVQLPAVTPGIKGMSLQGVISVGFGYATLAKLATKTAQGGELEAYTILFNNVALKLMGFTLPPGVMLDFILFAPPTAKDPSLGNLGWYLAYNNEEKIA